MSQVSKYCGLVNVVSLSERQFTPVPLKKVGNDVIVTSEDVENMSLGSQTYIVSDEIYKWFSFQLNTYSMSIDILITESEY